ncbi:hypothetical protein LMG28727_07242 [Paraburkholderia kirstenboschensis]|nr:hypothetical protein LMG28727_07242 [Paraburkholderia kirstenboschensis]
MQVESEDEELEASLSPQLLSGRRHQLRSALVLRFQLSLRDIEESVFERGVTVSYETIRRWCEKFGAGFAYRVKAGRRSPGRIWHLEEVFVTLRREPYLLGRAVDQQGAELDVLLQKRPGYLVVSLLAWQRPVLLSGVDAKVR